MSDKRPLGYLGGDIMTFGSNLARQYEYDKFKEAKRIGIKITDDDDLAKLADYTELKMLYIYGENEISQDTIDTVVKMLPNCEVRYREDTYGRIK